MDNPSSGTNVHRKHTHLTEVVPPETRARFAALVEIGMEGDFKLTSEFTDAINDAAQAASEHQRRNHHRNR